jgi:translation initiation factor 1 (eIF-1/SUI1)
MEIQNLKSSNSFAKEFEEALNEKIHIHLLVKTARKCITIIDGLELTSEEEKTFLKTAKTKFATSGYKKLMTEYNEKTEVYCFFGDKRYEFVELLKDKFGKSNDVIHVHG